METFGIICITLVCIILGLAILWVIPVYGKRSEEHWYKKMTYSKSYAINIQKEKDKSLRILAFSDLQLSDTLDCFGLIGNPLSSIKQLIQQEKPDFIIFMGDITWTALTKVSIKHFVQFMDRFKIPWAPIMGNHEDEKQQGHFCSVDLNWVADQFLKSKYCLLKKGPNNIGGVGNYVINIWEENSLRESLILMDTHAQQKFLNSHKLEYDYIYDSQLLWYEWVVNGNKNLNNGNSVESMLFIHIPLPEYKDAYAEWENSGFDANIGFGEKNEEICCSYINSGMFDLIKQLGSTKYVFAAHDHQNNFSVNYQGVQLTYTTKTGNRCDSKDGLTGGTRITIGKDVSIKHLYL